MQPAFAIHNFYIVCALYTGKFDKFSWYHFPGSIFFFLYLRIQNPFFRFGVVKLMDLICSILSQILKICILSTYVIFVYTKCWTFCWKHIKILVINKNLFIIKILAYFIFYCNNSLICLRVNNKIQLFRGS